MCCGGLHVLQLYSRGLSSGDSLSGTHFLKHMLQEGKVSIESAWDSVAAARSNDLAAELLQEKKRSYLITSNS